VSEPIERVLLALDAAAETRGAIDTAARLAARAGVRLHAVFVEDEELRILADLPVARHVVAGAGAVRLSAREVELQLRAAADRTRELVLIAARRHAVECSFEVLRGAAETALAAASERDLVVAAALVRPVAGHFRVESRWPGAHKRAPGPILLAHEGALEQRGAAVLLREKSEASARLVRAASLMAELADGSLTIICPPGLAVADGFSGWVEDAIGSAAVPRSVESAPAEPAELQRRLAELGCGVVAIGAAAAEGGLQKMRQLTERLGCSLLIVP
jgi:hypothetical protein